MLDDAGARARPGGRLIYATCSILPCENEDRVEAFLKRHPDFAIQPCAQAWRESVGTALPHGMETFFKASPLRTSTDGFFAAILLRAKALDKQGR